MRVLFSEVIRRTNKNVLLVSALILYAASFSLANTGEKVNIALITDKTSGLNESALVSLLEVELSQKEGINLLERAAIDKILEEQKLSAAGLQDRNTAIKIGKLLRADAFIILSLENQSEESGDLIRVRFAETAHGLRLLDYFEQSDNLNPKEAIGSIVKKIESVLSKLKQPDEKLIPVGIVDIHRVELDEKYKILERTLPTMLSVRLSLEPQIIMLEREDLKVLLDEKLRTEGEDSKFWNSAILIDGYIKPNNGQLEMYLNLKQAGGSIIKSLIVPVEPNEPIIAIDKVVTEIIQKLQDSPSIGRWNPKLEAEQFYKQGQMLANHVRNDEAMPVFEAAYALEPNNVFYTGAVFTRIMRNGSDSSPYSDMEIVNMASILVRQIRDNYEKGLPSTSQIPLKFAGLLGSHLGEGYLGSNYSVKTEEIRQINHENRKIWADILEDALRKQIAGNDPAQIKNCITAASLAWIKSDEPNEVIANLKKAFNEYLMPPKLGGCISSDSARKEIYKRFFAENYSHPLLSRLRPLSSHLKDSWDETKKLINVYLEELADINDSVVGIQSKLILFSDYQSFVDDLRKEFKTSKLNNSKYVTEAMIGLFGKIYYVNRFGRATLEERISIWEEFCGYVIDNNDTDTLTSLLLISSNPPLTKFLDSINDYANKNSKKIDIEKINELYMRYDSLLERISEKLNNNSNNNVMAALNKLKGIRDEIERKISGELPIEPEKPFSITMILNQKDWPEEIKIFYSEGAFLRRGFCLDVRNEMLWIAMGLMGLQDKDKIVCSIGLVGINLKQKKVVSLWQAKCEDILLINPVLSGLVINKKNSYISLDGEGIFVLPGILKEGRGYFENPQILTQDDGLPSISITSMVKDPSKDSGKLWVAYGGSGHESGLGIYDLETKEWETVFCSTLNGEPPFNSGYTYGMRDMRYINPDQLFFQIYSLGGAGSDKDKWRGYWLMDTNNYELNHIERVPMYSYYDRNVLRNSKIFDKSKITDRKILNGEYAETFLETPYGLIAIGEGTVGLIEDKE